MVPMLPRGSLRAPALCSSKSHSVVQSAVLLAELLTNTKVSVRYHRPIALPEWLWCDYCAPVPSVFVKSPAQMASLGNDLPIRVALFCAEKK